LSEFVHESQLMADESGAFFYPTIHIVRLYTLVYL
jgi:hypothetical protein